ncbi:MAG: hydrolase 1, exosortase A system-associated [Colwellia sp.]|nr:hydrolase 1, exosortase A system-associated [Colwellia sp.]MCW9081819.1 hydrolase 1, exosortase A system-associated [Colwellia sp.]
MIEQALSFTVNNQELLAISHHGSDQNTTGVLIVVGGPQYRVGSHRQFVQLSRALARQGISSLRFDYTGMGDSSGEKKEFDHICDDIKAATDAFLDAQPHLQKVVIWGLCDAASAALIYAHQDDRINGLVLLNPWLRSEQAMGKTMVKYYYLQRLLSKSFWKKLFSGQVNVAASARDAKGFVKDSVVADKQNNASYQARMLSGLQAFNGKVCLILSGEDLTAREFDQQTKNSKAWCKLRSENSEVHHLASADHTFSSREFKAQVEGVTFKFITQL